MERIRRLNRYQKRVLVIMIVMVLVFAALYSVTIARVGYIYKSGVLIPHEENGITTYSGRVKGENAVFTVSPNKIVEFQYGDVFYGPYTCIEDMEAIPEDNDIGPSMKGIEVRCGEEIIFRGGAKKVGDDWWLWSEDGSFDSMALVVTYSDGAGTVYGVEDDPMEPHVSDILNLISGPTMSHKGDWFAWFCGTVVCCMTAISMLFADELFRWNLSLLIRNADGAEPSEWEMTSRYITWTLLPVAALAMFIIGLR